MNRPTVPLRRLRYLDARDGAPVEAELEVLDEDGGPHPPGLLVHHVRLTGPGGAFEARWVRAAPGSAAGARALDNEILAGLRLRRVAPVVPAGRPFEVARLVGHDTTGNEPFALVEPYRGRPCGEEAARLLPHDLRRFQTSLVVGVRRMVAAGIVHRGLGPHTVRWDGDRVQITGFGHAALVGETRTAVGTPPWSAPEQRPERVAGEVTDRDDLWAVGCLVHYVATGTEPEFTEPGSAGPEPGAPLDLPPDLARLLADLFAAPERRPAVAEMLRRVGAPDPVPHAPEPDPETVRGHREFHTVRAAKNPAPPPAEAAPEPAAPPVPRWAPPYRLVGVAVAAVTSLLVVLLVVLLLVGGGR
ncbi:protein kinase domain-containing protein [Spirillospora sp. CA-253888]